MRLDGLRRIATELNPTAEGKSALLDDLDFVTEYEQAKWQERLRLLRWSGDPLASFLTGTNVELVYASAAAGTAKASFTSEVAINDTAGMGPQAHLPADFFLPAKGEIGRGLFIKASGIVSSTATPSYTWNVRSGTAASTSACRLLSSAALATASGIAAVPWWLEGDVILETIGAAGANSTVRGTGYLLADGYSAATTTRAFVLWGGAASPGTDATFDTSITNYLNFNITCTASSASNTITLHKLLLFGLN